jgi:hypothetical protein
MRPVGTTPHGLSTEAPSHAQAHTSRGLLGAEAGIQSKRIERRVPSYNPSRMPDARCLMVRHMPLTGAAVALYWQHRLMLSVACMAGEKSTGWHRHLMKLG